MSRKIPREPPTPPLERTASVDVPATAEHVQRFCETQRGWFQTNAQTRE